MILGCIALTFYQDKLCGNSMTTDEYADLILTQFNTEELTLAIGKAWEMTFFENIRQKDLQKSI